MSETIIIALISLLGTLGGTFGGILATSKLINYRIALLGGDGAGGFYLTCRIVPGNHSYLYGGRLLYVPTATV